MKKIRFLVNDEGAAFISGLPSEELEYWHTKLAFTDVPSLPGNQAITIRQGALSYSENERALYVPPGLKYPELCYVLRTLSDSMRIARGNLPLHGAVVGPPESQTLIFARPNHGKSYLAKLLAESNPNYTVIGDDHVVLTNRLLLGNARMRLRKPDGTEKRLSTARCGEKRLSLGVCFVFSQSGNTNKILPFDAWFEAALQATALKYLSAPFAIQGVRYQPEILWRNPEASRRARMLLQTNLNAKPTVFICGSQRYAANIISNLMER